MKLIIHEISEEFEQKIGCGLPGVDPVACCEKIGVMNALKLPAASGREPQSSAGRFILRSLAP
jgi:hypothetical protein